MHVSQRFLIKLSWVRDFFYLQNGKHLGRTAEFNRDQFQEMMRGLFSLCMCQRARVLYVYKRPHARTPHFEYTSDHHLHV